MKRYQYSVFCLFCLILALIMPCALTQKMIVNIPVANLRYQPIANDPNITLPTSDFTNPLQITQLLLGEYVWAYQSTTDAQGTVWYKVMALQQPYYHIPLGWHGYPGWIEAKNLIPVQEFPINNVVVKTQNAKLLDTNNHHIATLSIGTRLHATQCDQDRWLVSLPNKTYAYIQHDNLYIMQPTIQENIHELRKNIVQTAQQFLGNFYSWGGRSSQNNDLLVSSVDCSALTNLSFLAHGLQIPRMSHEQFLRCEKIQHAANLQPADLIFLSSISKHTPHMDHVMMYLGDNKLIEATFVQDHTVRIIDCNERANCSFKDLQSGDIIHDKTDSFFIYFGSFLHNKQMIQTLQAEALTNNFGIINVPTKAMPPITTK